MVEEDGDGSAFLSLLSLREEEDRPNFSLSRAFVLLKVPVEVVDAASLLLDVVVCVLSEELMLTNEGMYIEIKG